MSKNHLIRNFLSNGHLRINRNVLSKISQMNQSSGVSIDFETFTGESFRVNFFGGSFFFLWIFSGLIGLRDAMNRFEIHFSEIFEIFKFKRF